MLLTVAAGQFAASQDVNANLTEVRRLTHLAADAGARILVLPEATLAPFSADLREVAQPWDGMFPNAIREVAARTGVALIAGLFVPHADGRVTNSLLATDGVVEARYDKIHLFDALGHRESDTVAPGDQIVTVELAGVRIGLATCYDLRFPDQFTALGLAGAQIVAVPASWGAGPGKTAQWQLVTRARAADAQAWLVASDQAWTEPSGRTPLGVGASQIVDPLGQVRAALGPDPGLLVASLDLSEVDQVRASLPLLSHGHE